MVIDGHVENITHEIKNLIVGLLQLLYLEQFYKEEAEKEDKPVDIIDGEEVISHDKIESFQDEKMVLIWKCNITMFVN